MSTLYDFLMQNKMEFMHALVDRNRKNPQRLYDLFKMPDNPADLNKANFGLGALGAVRVEKKDMQPNPDMQPKSLVQRIQDMGKKTVMLGEKALKRSKKALGYNVQDEQPKDKQPRYSHEAWVRISCRDPRQLAGIEKEVRMPGWSEVKDPQTREKYKEAGHSFYEYELWIMVLFYDRPNSKYAATMIYRHPGPLSMKGYHGQLSFMLDTMTGYLKPRQQAKPPVQMPELEKQEPDVDNSIVIAKKYPASFAIEVEGERAAGRLVMGNMPSLTQDQINKCIASLGDKDYSAAPLSGNRIAMAKRLHEKPSEEIDVMWIRMNMKNDAEEFAEKVVKEAAGDSKQKI